MGVLLLPSLLPSVVEACGESFTCTLHASNAQRAATNPPSSNVKLQMVAGSYKDKRADQLRSGIRSYMHTDILVHTHEHTHLSHKHLRIQIYASFVFCCNTYKFQIFIHTANITV